MVYGTRACAPLSTWRAPRKRPSKHTRKSNTRVRAQTLSYLGEGADGVAVDSEWDIGRLSGGLCVDIDLRHGSTTGRVDQDG